MKVQIKDIVNGISTLQKISDTEMHIRTSYAVAKLLREVISEMELYDKQRIKLCDKYGTKNGDRYDITDTEGFSAEITQLLDTEVSLNSEKINLSDEDVKITATEFMAVEKFVEV